MRRKSRTLRGRQCCHSRNVTVERAFGRFMKGRGFRQFQLGTLEGMNQERLLICTGHNLAVAFSWQSGAGAGAESIRSAKVRMPGL